MKIVLTGASSFTGYWFARTLHEKGISLVMPLLGELDSYEGVRAARVRQLQGFGEVVPNCPFGSADFLGLLSSAKPDVLCHHAAQVGDYRNPDFDIPGAVAANTSNIRAIVSQLASFGSKIVVTGSVFEANEGAGGTPLVAFSPYGVSKGLSAAVVEYWASAMNLPYGKFVIPNPFGPFEDPRFCSFLLRTWRAGEVARVQTPAYVRDNIHVDLLALAYADFVTSPFPAESCRLNPSGYVETQGAFAQRFAKEVGGRLNMPAVLELADQIDFPEPVVRINVDRLDISRLGWSETAAWDKLAAYYADLA